MFFFKFQSIKPILINGEVVKIVKVRGAAEGATGVGGATGAVGFSQLFHCHSAGSYLVHPSIGVEDEWPRLIVK